jgi:2-polyprenyl-3-methyl-5-hydroxy-6-metoxy-1,4-benzoquinol methylase
MTESKTQPNNNGVDICLDCQMFEICTRPGQWEHTLEAKIEIRDDGASKDTLFIQLRLSVIKGAVGAMFVTGNSYFEKNFDTEISVRQFVFKHPFPDKLIFRNVYPHGHSEFQIEEIQAEIIAPINISDIVNVVWPELITCEPNDFLDRVSVYKNLNSTKFASLYCSKETQIEFDLNKLFPGSFGAELKAAFSQVNEVIENTDAAKLSNGMDIFSTAYLKSYARASLLRLYHLLKALDETGLSTGKILDVGAYFGLFSIPLQHFGYSVTALDRYDFFDGGLDFARQKMSELGVNVVSTTQSTEFDQIDRLGDFDAVVCMAVIEHIPHTPRPFLEALVNKIKPSGWLFVDTPNLVAKHNRDKFSRGISPFGPIEMQWQTEGEFTGHHREFTSSELVWMLTELGLEEIKQRTFFYNVGQYEKLNSHQVNELLQDVHDSTYRDVLLAWGQFS